MQLKKLDITGPNGKFAAHINKMIDEINALKAIKDPNTLTEATTAGTRVRPKELGTGQGGTGEARWG